ncbi:MAG TPA: helix-turn-helix domain-containing protein [Mycobacterium sp.]|uniref:TetR/AcrR family transcriptional regulator n=1 Tax=Mycobacterium sp. TaxID=1785 RepID=UPI002D4B3B06|nr:helix-turn-helix domain-containing protein [Mycobacterium sp.]HXY66917.1 helix-turn-helix domain-containing protein [Mycobacterium sp.]
MPKVSAQYRDERRAHILAAARRCFVRDGFHQTSMQDLVREAGMSSGAVYRYFASKDAMIVAIAEENLDQIVAIVRESVADGADLGAALAAALEFASSRHADDGFAAIALIVWSEALRNPALAERLRKSFDQAGEALAETARGITPTGTELAPDVLAKTLLCVLPGYLLQLAIRGADAVAPVADAVRELFPQR